MKEKDAHAYELEIKRMIKDRLGSVEAWLNPQIEATAMNRVMLSKIQKELEGNKSLMMVMPGSTGQMKKDAHPLLPHYKELQRTLILQYEALGLSFKSNPMKLKTLPDGHTEEKDKLSQLLDDVSRI